MFGKVLINTPLYCNKNRKNTFSLPDGTPQMFEILHKKFMKPNTEGNAHKLKMTVFSKKLKNP